MYFFCQKNIDLKYIFFFCNSTGGSILEIYLKYTSSILEVYFKYTSKVYFQFIWSILKVYFILVKVISKINDNSSKGKTILL